MKKLHKKKINLIWIPIITLISLGLVPGVLSEEKRVDVITVDGVINPIVAEYIAKSIDRAVSEKAEAIVIELDTPGGLDPSMRTIIKKIMASEVPVIVYVSPSGGRAASAGVFITMAAHIAAMTPGTNIGAAHPVALGGEKMDKEMAEKVVNDAAAYIKGIAHKRERNEKWAEEAVRASVSITAEEALKLNVIDLLVKDIQSLLQDIDGRRVVTEIDTITLNTKETRLNREPMGLRARILNLLSDPNIAYILMILGFYGLIFELSNPGSILPGVIGGICLILAFYAFQTLPVNYTGLLLIALALIFFIAEIKVTSYGLLTIAGIISLTLGSLMLFESPAPFLRVSIWVILPTVLIVTTLFLGTMYYAVKIYRKSPVSGIEGFIAKTGIADTDIMPEGKVFIEGEYWNAWSDEPIKKGEKIKVTEVSGLKLRVSKT